MHILVNDHTANSLPRFMESATAWKRDKKFEMIQTTPRIERNLATRIGDQLKSRLECTAPSSRMFPEVNASFPSQETISQYRRFKSLGFTPPSEKRHFVDAKHERIDDHFFFVKQDHRKDLSCRKQDPSSNHSNEKNYYGTQEKSKAPENNQSNLNGFINGFIVNTDASNEEQAHPPRKHDQRYGNRNEDDSCDPKHARRKSSPALNENNNNHTFTNSPRQKTQYDESVKSSNILEKMYASFGTKMGKTNHRYLSQTNSLHRDHSERQATTQDDSPKRKFKPVHPTPVRMEGDDMNRETSQMKRRKLDDSPVKSDCRTTSQTKLNIRDRERDFHAQNNECSRIGRRSDDRFLKNYSPPTREEEGKTSSHSDLAISHPERSPLNSRSENSPNHSIDSLLGNQSNGRQYSSPQKYGDEIVPERTSPPQFQREYEHSPKSTTRYNHRETRCQNHSPYAGSKADRGESDRKEDEHDKYNEKSREIFMREKEMIENSLRQNGLPMGLPQAPYLQNPYMMNPSTLAVLQNSLLSSMHPNAAAVLPDPGMALKTASLAVAASTNPLLLGLNQYFSNPYLLRSLVANGLSDVAYGQALSQGLLPQHHALIPLLNPMSGNPSVQQAANPLLYGGIHPDPQITAALAASMRQESASSYQLNGSSYPFAPPHVVPPSIESRLNHMYSNRKQNETDPNKPSPSRDGIRAHSENNRTPDTRAAQIEQRLSVDEENLSTKPTRKAEREIGRRRQSNDHTPTPTFPVIASKPVETHRGTGSDLRPRPPRHPSSVVSHSPSSKLKRKIPHTMYSTPKKQIRVPSDNKMDKSSKLASNSIVSPRALDSFPKKKKDLVLPEVPSMNEKNSLEVDKSSTRPPSYKNLTRERRLVANARERTRVHTISSAFEDLRQQIPSYSCNQKLSKLAILRIACSYIRSLSVLSGRNTQDTFSDSVDQCTRVLQAESRARSRRKSNKAQIEWEVANYEKGQEVGGETSNPSRYSFGTPEQDNAHSSVSNSMPKEGTEQVCDESVQQRFQGEATRSSTEVPGDQDLCKERTSNDDADIVSARQQELSPSDSLNQHSELARNSAAVERVQADSSMVHYKAELNYDTWRESDEPKQTVFVENDHRGIDSSPKLDLPDNKQNIDEEDLQNDEINVED